MYHKNLYTPLLVQLHSWLDPDMLSHSSSIKTYFSNHLLKMDF